MSEKLQSVAIAVVLLLVPASVCRGALSFYVDPGNPWPAGWYNAAVANMQTVVNMYNAYGDFGNGSIYVYYNAGIPTAQSGYGGYGGSIGDGGTYPNVRVLLHESSHWLGTGTYSNYWSGPHAAALIQQFDGIGAVLNGDSQHYWPYGENYDSESSPINDARHVAMVYALREDFGIGSTAPPSSATNVTLTASDAVGTSGFNYPWGWSDGHFAQPGTNYSTGDFALRTPNGYPSWTFAGASLTVNNHSNPNGGLLFNGWGTTGVVTINNLILDGGTITHDQNPQDVFQLAGNIALASTSTINAANGNIKILAGIGGSGSLIKTGAYSLTLAGANTFGGNTTISGGTLVLSGASSIINSTGIMVNGSGAGLLQTSSVPLTPAVTLSNGTLDGIGAVGAVTVGNGTGGVLTNGNGTAGALTMSSLTFSGIATDNVRIIGGASFTMPGQIVTNALTTPTTTGPVTVNIPASAGLTNGTYDLIQYGSLVGGGLSGFSRGTITGLGNHQTATLGASGTYITLVVGGYRERFTGADSNVWHLGSTGSNHNFRPSSGGGGYDYADGDAVLFDNTPASSGTYTVNITSAVAPASTWFENSTPAYSITSSGGFGIAGSGGLTKDGTGLLTVATANTYTGATAINAGTVSVSANNNLGADTAPVTLNGGTLKTTAGMTNTHALTIGASGGTINVNSTGSGGSGQYFFNSTNTLLGNGPLTLTGNGTLTTTGAGNLRIAQTNSYNGPLTVTAGGIFEYGTAGAVDPAATFTIANQGEVAVQGGGATSLSNNITVTGGTNSVLSFENGDLGVFSGPIALNAGANFIVGLRDWYNYANVHSGMISGVISGSGNLAVNSGSGAGGMLTLSGANTYTGATIINNATLQMNSTNATSASVTVNNGGTLALNIGDALGFTAGKNLVTINSGGTVTNVMEKGRVTLWNGVTMTGGTLTSVGAGDGNGAYSLSTQVIATSDASGTAATISGGPIGLQNRNVANGFVTFNVSRGSAAPASDLTVSANLIPVSFALGNGITKTGNGIMTLSGANTYTGNVIVNGGTLNAANDVNAFGRTDGSFGNPSVAGRTVTINNGATVALTAGNVLGSGGQTTPPALSFVVNAGGVLKTTTSAIGTVASGNTGQGDANIFGNITLNGGTLTTGNGYSAQYQSAILLGTVTVGGNTPSTINTNATNTVANGLMLGTSGGTTFNVGATGSAAPDLTISAKLVDANSGSPGSLIKTGAGTLLLSGANTYGGPTTITGGTLRLNMASSSPTIASGAMASVSSGATLELAGSVSALGTAGGNRAHIVNNSLGAAAQPAGLLVSGPNQVVGGIDGPGSTQVNAGGKLTADHIIQTALVIGGTAGNPALVTIDASNANGLPLVEVPLLAGALESNAPLTSNNNLISSTDLGANSASSFVDPAIAKVGSIGTGEQTSIPEPTSILLLILGGLATLPLARQRIGR